MSDVTGAKVAKSLLLVAKRVEENKDYLCELDGEVGDGDHGVSMTIGMRAVTRAVNNLPDSVTPQAAFVAAAGDEAMAGGLGVTGLHPVEIG